MSRAKDQFDESIKDAQELLAHFEAARRAKGSSPPENAEVLKRAGLILAITAWETYVEDRAREALEAILIPVADTRAGQFMKNKFEDEMKRFHNPNSEKTARLFTDYIGKDPTVAWKCNPGGNAKAKSKLDEWVKRRGEAAHRSRSNGPGQLPPSHLISREELGKLINFLKALVTDTETGLV